MATPGDGEGRTRQERTSWGLIASTGGTSHCRKCWSRPCCHAAPWRRHLSALPLAVSHVTCVTPAAPCRTRHCLFVPQPRAPAAVLFVAGLRVEQDALDRHLAARILAIQQDACAALPCPDLGHCTAHVPAWAGVGWGGQWRRGTNWVARSGRSLDIHGSGGDTSLPVFPTPHTHTPLTHPMIRSRPAPCCGSAAPCPGPPCPAGGRAVRRAVRVREVHSGISLLRFHCNLGSCT